MMVTANDIVDAISDVVEETFSGDTCYTKYLPNQFTRPSCYVEFIKKTTADANAVLLDVIAEVSVTGFVQVDDYYDSTSSAINAKGELLTDMFCGRGFKVCDRWLTVTATVAEYGLDYVKVTATLSYMDDRLSDEEIHELMQNIKINNKIIGG